MARLTGGDPSLLRRINSAVVLHALREAGSPTLTDLTRITGLSRPTVEGVVEGRELSVGRAGPDVVAAPGTNAAEEATEQTDKVLRKTEKVAREA